MGFFLLGFCLYFMISKLKKIIFDNKEKIAATVTAIVTSLIVLFCSGCILGSDAVEVVKDCINGVCIKK